jgi:DNA primase
MSVTQEIKSRLDIVDVVSEFVPLRKSGRSFAGFCPFHPNTRTPAFYVFPETQTWYCFGACAEGGDLFSFVMKKQGWDFKDALVNLAESAGVVLEDLKPVDKVKEEIEKRLSNLLAAAADYFHQLLRFAPQAELARHYVSGRGLSEDTVADFRVGFALDSWDACRTHFNSHGYDDEDLLAAGLLTENPDKGTRYDRFRNRLMIPIRDAGGRVVGFGARTLETDGIPKYLNSPQTALFNKSHLLYGLDVAKPNIREARHVVIVEGYMDVMQAWQAGFRNVVAQMGTALTEEQLRHLKRFTKRFILALDSDAAGLKATLRGLQVARETLDREFEVRFDARGLVKHEGRLKADIRVVTLPAGMDPDEIIRTDRDQWPKLLAQAKPVIEYVIDLVTADLNVNDAKAKSSVAQQILPLIGDIADPIERDHYRQQLARALRVDERALRLLAPVERRSRQAVTGQTQGRSIKGTTLSEVREAPEQLPESAVSVSRITLNEFRQANYLRQCLHYPQVMVQINQKLAQNKQPMVSEVDFGTPEDKALLRHMYQYVNDRTVVTSQDLCDSLDDLLLTRVQTLSTLPASTDSELDRLADTLVLSVLDWRLERIKHLLGEVKQLYQEAVNAKDVEVLDLYKQQMRDLPLSVLKINRAKDAMSAIGRRRAEDAAFGHP